MQTPLLLVVLRVGLSADSEPYARVLRDVFRGKYPSYAATDSSSIELLQSAEIREFTLPEPPNVFPLTQRLVDSSERCLVIILDARGPLAAERPGADTEALLLPLFRMKRFRIVNTLIGVSGSVFSESDQSKGLIRLALDDLDERDLRLPLLALYALHNALQLFGGQEAQEQRRLFLSHAKRDGVPLTTAALAWMNKLKGFSAFYDTVNLDLDGDLDAQLESAVANGIVIVFRTDVFDQRYWCQKEVLWAEFHGRPVLTVDARYQVEHAASLIGFDATPSVRIPDGNVIRIFMAALTEALRIDLFRARAQAVATGHGLSMRMESIPRFPSLISLHAACTSLARREREEPPGAPQRHVIVYPNPSLPHALANAVKGIANSMLRPAEVLSLDELRITA